MYVRCASFSDLMHPVSSDLLLPANIRMKRQNFFLEFIDICMLHFLALAITLIMEKTDGDIIVAVAFPDLGSDPPFWLSARMPR